MIKVDVYELVFRRFKFNGKTDVVNLTIMWNSKFLSAN